MSRKFDLSKIRKPATHKPAISQEVKDTMRDNPDLMVGEVFVNVAQANGFFRQEPLAVKISNMEKDIKELKARLEREPNALGFTMEWENFFEAISDVKANDFASLGPPDVNGNYNYRAIMEAAKMQTLRAARRLTDGGGNKFSGFTVGDLRKAAGGEEKNPQPSKGFEESPLLWCHAINDAIKFFQSDGENPVFRKYGSDEGRGSRYEINPDRIPSLPHYARPGVTESGEK